MSAGVVQYQEAVDAWAERYENMVGCADSFYSSLNFSEAEALANLLAVTGRYDLARDLMLNWAEFDPEMAEAYRDAASEWHAENDAREAAAA